MHRVIYTRNTLFRVAFIDRSIVVVSARGDGNETERAYDLAKWEQLRITVTIRVIAFIAVITRLSPTVSPPRSRYLDAK